VDKLVRSEHIRALDVTARVLNVAAGGAGSWLGGVGTETFDVIVVGGGVSGGLPAAT
jgi:alanine dehydrogenase